MNVIVIVSDTLRYDHLGCNGNSVIRTPHLDAFAQQAMVFERCYQASFPTIPTRMDLFCGKYMFPQRGWEPLPKDEPVMAQIFGDEGYTSMLICDTPHLVKDGFFFDRGFTAWHWNRGQEGDRASSDDIPLRWPCDPKKDRSPEVMARGHLRYTAKQPRLESDRFVARTMTDAMDWLDLNASHDPFFLWVDTFDPHEPWDPPQYYVDLYADPDYAGDNIFHPRYDLWRNFCTWPEVQQMRALYAGEVTLVDTWTGYLLEKIERMGLHEDTIVVFLSDHGFCLGEHDRVGKSRTVKGQAPWPFYDVLAHCNLMVKVPGLQPGRTAALVQLTDLLPTFCELLEVSPPDGLTGESLAPVLRGQSDTTQRNVAITSARLTSGGDAYVTATDGEWTLHANGPAAPSLLYHLPDEATDRSQEEPDRAADLRGELLALLERLGSDPAAVDRLRAGA